GQVNPAFEHFMSNLIRQKLIVAIDSLTSNRKEGARKFTLFLPHGENHELGLLFANYMLRARGHNTIYLGQNLPHTELEPVIAMQKTDYLLTSVTSIPENFSVQAFINDLGARYKNVKIAITGYQISSDNSIVAPKNVKFIRSIQEMLDFIEQV
ncbi:MAG TPA: helix-turn-helix-type transcriptional regulator, partial [Bacteroidia bacterium]|nr:helix-turn-helix-type transcriptional regulator [Bacteroidia bacterium]